MPATQVGATSLAQVAFVAAALVSDIGAPHGVLVVLHLLLAGMGAVIMRWRLTAVPFMVVLYALITFDFATARTIDEPIVTVAFAALTLTAPMAVMLYRGWWPVAASALVTPAVLACLGLARPGLDRTLTTAILTTNTTILLAAVMLMSIIRRFGDRADSFQQEAAAERQRAVRSRTAIAVAVDDARTLHDTVINTLGALASGAPGLLDRAVVRERCRQDADRVEELLTSEGDRHDLPWRFEWQRPGSLEVHRRGLDDEQLARYAALLPPTTARALQGCVDEAILNASKHSGADHIDVSILVQGNEFIIEIADGGVGFDGRIVPGRGLAESIFARANGNGIRANLRTAPGAGTHLTLTYRLDQPNPSSPAPPQTAPDADIVDTMHRRFCWTWAILMLAAGAVTETINRRGHLTDAHLMLALAAALALLAWWTCRGRRNLPRWLTVAIVLGAPGACALAYRAVDFGWDQAFLLQTAALTPLFAILLVLAPSPRPLIIALILMIVAIAMPAAFHPGPGLRPLVVVVIMSIPLFALLGAWFFFYRGLQVFGRRFARAWHLTQLARHDLTARQAADAMRRRWSAAGLESSVSLLREIADGNIDSADAHIRQRCLDEENYLREIAYLVPDQTPISWWLALALAEARSRTVQAHLQIGTVAVTDPVAEAFGRLVMACVRSAQVETSLVISLFTYHGTTRLFVVSNDPDLAGQLPPAPAGCRIHLQASGSQTVLEAEWTGGNESTHGAAREAVALTPASDPVIPLQTRSDTGSPPASSTTASERHL